jgi:molecular chaperone GrpE
MTQHEGKSEQGTAPEKNMMAPPAEPASERPAASAAGAAAPGAAGAAAEMAERLAAAEAEAARLKEEYLRALAETENVRKRAARDRQDAGQYAITGFARDLLSVADNLQRALASVDAGARAADPALAALVDGVEMTEKELLGVLERHGVKPIDAHGQPFDPHVHEAMFELPDASVAHGTVVQVLQAGYRLHDRTLRPARVGIARGGPKPGAARADAPEEAAGEPAMLAEDDGVIQFPNAGGGKGDAYRNPEERDAAGQRIDETT